jgi:hypothetical protein
MATEDQPIRIPVYLSSRVVKDLAGSEITFSERRLIRQSGRDRVIAVIEAPRGSRVRLRKDHHGLDHLEVPCGRSLWARLFGPRVTIPAKYVISDARRRAYGLSLMPMPPASRPELATAESTS